MYYLESTLKKEKIKSVERFNMNTLQEKSRLNLILWFFPPKSFLREVK